MFEFDELEAALPPEAFVVHGAGQSEIDGLYEDTKLEQHGAAIFRHSVMSDQLLSREAAGDRFGWVLGANRRVLYGCRTEKAECPKSGWRAFKGERPAPRLVEGFSSVADAARRLSELWCEEAESLVAEQRFRPAAEVYKRCLAIPVLAEGRKAELHGFRARTFRQLAESKKKPRDASAAKAPAEKNGEEDPLHGLAAEWAIEEAEEALKRDQKCFLAAWEGAIAAKHIGWWNKGRILAKKAMQAVPSGPAHRAQRETASTLFLLMAEEEQEEKARKVREMQKAREVPEAPADPKELHWAHGIATQLNDALKAEDFKRPHHQLWKLIGPGLLKKDSDEIFSEIRQLVWEKWNAVAWQHGYRTSWDVNARKKMCARIVDAANSGRAEEVRKLVKEIEDRCCIEWQEIAEAKDAIRHDQTWAWTKREDGSYGAWDGPTSL